ncbi:hypothetical protein [Salisediminibacterium halotolerans]|uniref:hypothetical protein n=1 Tax=Salisediminibacterium halotolerans TaxID=517425 RepID=UPI000F1A8399|nr:hypothetical protein [Salisediminibacterium halotolerans]RLJ73163.1 hypothetical protein BCL39_1912 [Actinophytocola xinjiangensis]RPE86585.1 hypothetical protein EDD67_2035 [Salisediminibacterium halotolerans]TWG33960.1 hypothetical protein BCL52_1909 [Salisediminibacterium halotolerans]GEL06632.1 hypothetical protein SHA02_00480 [Salisediminibacterium halotolerans]
MSMTRWIGVAIVITLMLLHYTETLVIPGWLLLGGATAAVAIIISIQLYNEKKGGHS